MFDIRRAIVNRSLTIIHRRVVFNAAAFFNNRQRFSVSARINYCEAQCLDIAKKRGDTMEFLLLGAAVAFHILILSFAAGRNGGRSSDSGGTDAHFS